MFISTKENNDVLSGQDAGVIPQIENEDDLHGN